MAWLSKKSGYSSSVAQSNGSDSQTQERKNSGTKPKRRLNPRDSFGNISECSICGSRFHWAKVLESVGEQAEEDKEVLITLFTKGSQSQNVTDETECDALLGETLSYVSLIVGVVSLFVVMYGLNATLIHCLTLILNLYK